MQRFGDVWPSAECYVPPLEVLLEESRRRQYGHFKISHLDSTLRADIYVAGDDELNAWALHRRVRGVSALEGWVERLGFSSEWAGAQAFKEPA